MIPILQFDPATLTLWYDTQLLASARSSREVGLALHYALDGREDWLKCLVRQQTDPWTRTRCATVASAVWHEKRHFLDFVLTNYGAMRLRQFFQCYLNTRAFLQVAKESGRILVPLDRNLDSLRCEMMEISCTNPELLKLATWIQDSKEALLSERQRIVKRGSTYEMGGEAILECIAYHVQLGKTHRVFGAELNASVQTDNIEKTSIADKYQWVFTVLLQSGLMKAEYQGQDSGMGRIMLQDGPLIPLLYGALAGRYHQQPQTQSAFVSSAHPAERLVSLIAHYDEHKIGLADMTNEEAWESVNAACKQIFGRDVTEEIDADYAKEGEFIAYLRSTGIDEFVNGAYEDFHRLRGRIIQTLKDDPKAVLDQAKWSDSFVNKTRPFVVAAAPAGIIGEPPNGFERLSGYSDPGADLEKHPDYRWWWTAIRVEPDADEAQNIFRLGDQKDWSRIIADFAPVAKLMIDGNRMRSMVGPELMSTKIRIERQTGVELIIDSLSRFPVERFDISEWYFLTGRDSFRCQVTHQIVRVPHGRIIGPWEFRRKPAFRRALLEYLSGEPQARMLRAIWRDWSPWLVCDEVGALFDAAKVETEFTI